MLHANNEDTRSESSFNSDNDGSSGSEVQYPLINLKEGLTNDLQERRKKEIEKMTNKNKQGFILKRSTEFSRAVLGHNKMSQFEMSKAVNYIFSEFDYLREKLKRAQQQTIKQLQEIHLEKRRQLRESHNYHNEEIRYDLQRMKDEEKFLIEQAKIEEMMRRRERSIARLSMERKALMKEINENDKGNTPRTVRKHPKKIEVRKESLKQEIMKSHSFLHAGAIEVTKDFNEPRAVKRSMEYISVLHDTDTSADEEEDNKKEEEMVHNNDNVEDFNSEIGNQIELTDTTEDHDQNESIINTRKTKTVKEIMDQRRKEKQRKLREILSLPYDVYRRNSKGKLQKVDYTPSKQEFKEPSNKEKYKMRKVLDEERERYHNSISKLTRTTEMIIQEDMKITRQLNAPQQKVVKEPVVAPRNELVPKDWMRRFVSSNIPPDIDPNSTEAILFCRHIRVPLHKFSHLPNYKLYFSPL